MIATQERLVGPLFAGVDVGATRTAVDVLDGRGGISLGQVDPGAGGAGIAASTFGMRRFVIGCGIAAARPALRPIRTRIASGRASSPLGQRAPGGAALERLSDAVPGARTATAIARHPSGLPEREGVGER